MPPRWSASAQAKHCLRQLRDKPDWAGTAGSWQRFFPTIEQVDALALEKAAGKQGQLAGGLWLWME